MATLRELLSALEPSMKFDRASAPRTKAKLQERMLLMAGDNQFDYDRWVGVIKRRYPNETFESWTDPPSR